MNCEDLWVWLQISALTPCFRFCNGVAAMTLSQCDLYLRHLWLLSLVRCSKLHHHHLFATDCFMGHKSPDHRVLECVGKPDYIWQINTCEQTSIWRIHQKADPPTNLLIGNLVRPRSNYSDLVWFVFIAFYGNQQWRWTFNQRPCNIVIYIL